MKGNSFSYLAAACLACATPVPTMAAPDIEFSGFARIVAGILDDSDASYVGYDDSFTLDEDSLIGGQAILKFNDKFSVTGQGVARADSNDDSGVNWLYLSYRPTAALQIKAGKMQTPFFAISDTVDVGYSYPWAVAPREVYSNYYFSSYQGVDLRYTFFADNYTAHLEAFYGGFDDTVEANGDNIDTNVEGFHGLIGDLRVDNLRLRASFHAGDVSLDFPDIDAFASILLSSGFAESANSIETDGNYVYTQLSADYDSLSFFTKLEWTKITAERNLYSETNSYYFTYGRYFGKFAAHATYASKNEKLGATSSEIPVGISPQLDQLAFGYQAIFENRTEDDIRSLTLGLRWDFRASMALKCDLKTIELKSEKPSSFDIREGASFDNKVNALFMAWEWVF